MKPGAPDGRGRRALAGPRFAQEQYGKILHPVPELRFEPADIVGEDAVPEVLSERFHRGRIADQAVADEIISPAQLVEYGKVPHAVRFRETECPQFGQHPFGKTDPAGDIAVLQLDLYQFIEIVRIAMKNVEKKYAPDQLEAAPLVLAQIGPSRPPHLFYAGRYAVHCSLDGFRAC